MPRFHELISPIYPDDKQTASPTEKECNDFKVFVGAALHLTECSDTFAAVKKVCDCVEGWDSSASEKACLYTTVRVISHLLFRISTDAPLLIY